MGSWFSNLHIRKKEGISLKQILDVFKEMMEKAGYQFAASAETADCGLAVLSGEQSDWFSIYSDAFSFEEPEKFVKLGLPCGQQLHTDVLGISCMDSDYLYLNLLNPDENMDGWICTGSGKAAGIQRRRSPAQWKEKVADYPSFLAKVSAKYDCAEELLDKIADNLKLPANRSNMDYSWLEDFALQEQAACLFFKLPETEQKELPRFVMQSYSLMPCKMGKESVVSCNNAGGKSRGVSVYFIGDYVEKDEITFTDVQWQQYKRDNEWEYCPIALEKVQLADGNWAYRGHDPDYRIPPKVNPALPPMKQLNTSYEREITVRFTPQGNERKRLDIAVVFVPDENPAGQVGWVVWAHAGSKESFLREHNEWLKKVAPQEVIPEDSVDL